ncbi:MAG: Quinone oxidoreductase [Myxococcaceae bacterium]|nr:Quinone oxidoreductase [Myxococcaceae bacterium]
MRAIRVHEPGAPSVMRFEETVSPKPGPKEVLVEVRAVGVNPVDTYIRSGAYSKLPSYPYIPGNDGAGVVRAVGVDVSNFAVGDQVYLLGSGLGLGAYAEMAVYPASSVARFPSTIGFAQAAAINVPYATAHRALFARAHLLGGETILIHGASGGVGIAALQLAVAAGATVLATAGTDRGLRLVGEHGAHRAFDHNKPGYELDILRAAPRGVDVVIENLANVNFDRDLELVAPFGRIVIVGNRGRADINPRAILQKDAVVSGMALWNATDSELASIHAALYAGLANQTLRPVVGREFALRDAAAAHEAVLAPGAYGKIVLIPEPR